MTDALAVIFPGAYTTIQDLGRFDYQHMGVPISGALDAFAHRIANWLVGNPETAATLEMTIGGSTLRVLRECDIAVTGASMGLAVNDVEQPEWTSIRVRPDDIVRIGLAQSGCRAYLSITGGVDVPKVMGSRATFVGAKLGGLEGRRLQAGDILKSGAGSPLPVPRRLPWAPLYSDEISLRAIPGPYADYFGNSIESFFSTTFTVGAQSNRMGYRLEGASVQRDTEAPGSIISEPTVPGNVQIPPGGEPIVLMNEQTIGGYASIATVISADLFKLAQATPGSRVRFVSVTLNEAHRFLRLWNDYLNDIRNRLFEP
jgi:biotin-dependent carboxylase-like uncharacterized protein